jgi:hypothetical protein
MCPETVTLLQKARFLPCTTGSLHCQPTPLSCLHTCPFVSLISTLQPLPPQDHWMLGKVSPHHSGPLGWMFITSRLSLDLGSLRTHHGSDCLDTLTHTLTVLTCLWVETGSVASIFWGIMSRGLQGTDSTGIISKSYSEQANVLLGRQAN